MYAPRGRMICISSKWHFVLCLYHPPGLGEHVKEMEAKLAAAPHNGTPAINLSSTSGTNTQMEKTATDLGKLKCYVVPVRVYICI